MMRFFDFLFPPRADERALRAVSDDDFLSLIMPRLMSETRPATVTLLPFSDARVRSTLHEAKYHGSERAFALLGAALSDFLPDYIAETRFNLVARLNLVSVIVPVPLGKARHKERGFNQAEEIARRAIRILGEGGRISLESDLLERARETPTQVALPRAQREKNMRGAFTASLKLRSASRAELANTLFIVLDDVVTTGATLQAACDALRAAGAIHILPIALAH